MTAPFLITGCGRSGTGWAAALFTDLGYPCTHEGQFSLTQNGPLRGGESSWLAVPHLASLGPSIRVLRILRDPYEVVISALYKGFLRDTDEPYAAYAIRHCPDIGRARDEVGRVIRWVTLWDRSLDAVPHGRIYCGDPATGTAEAVRYATGQEPDLAAVLRTTRKIGHANASWRLLGVRPSEWKDLNNHPDGLLLRQRAHLFGYDTKEMTDG